MLFTALLLASLLFFPSCEGSGSGSGTPGVSDWSTITVDNSAVLEASPLPEDITLTVSYDIEDAMWDDSHDYIAAVYFNTGSGSIFEIKTQTLSGQSGTISISFSIDDTFFDVVTANPYEMFVELQDLSTSIKTVLDSTDYTTFSAGALTAKYAGYIRNYTSGYSEIEISLHQYGSALTGSLKGEDTSGDPVTVDLSGTVTGDDINLTLSGPSLGGSTGSVTCVGVVDIYGDGLHLDCQDFQNQSDSSIGGMFHADRIGFATVTGTVNIPADNAAAIHTALDGKDWAVTLMFDFDAEKHGGIGWAEAVWDSSSESMSYTLSKIPDGEYSVVFLSDCGADGNDEPTEGDCFGVAGLSDDETETMFLSWVGGSTPTAPTITVSAGSTITADDIELWLIDLP